MNGTPDNDVHERPTTQKMATIPAAHNEKEYAQMKYDAALKEMLADPNNQEKIAAFTEANTFLYHTQDLYRIGARSLIERNVEKERARSIKTIRNHIFRNDRKKTFTRRIVELILGL